MSGTIAMEGQLNGVVKEYLEFYGFDMTLEKFNEECSQKGKTIINLERKANSNNKNYMIINEMIALFNQGQRKEFFRRWIENVPEALINEDVSAQQLEFELNIHFAIFLVRRGGKEAVKKPQYSEGIAAFKDYIENKGNFICQTKEYQRFFSLPYNQDPQSGYPDLFTEAWMADLTNKLDTFLNESLKMQNQPRLVEMCSHQQEYKDSLSTITNLKNQLMDAEKRAMAFMKKASNSQRDYYALIGLAAELVDSLESTIAGKPIAPEYIANIVNRLFNTQYKPNLDLRPGTAGDMIRKSVAFQKPIVQPKITFPPLDFPKIKHDLIYQNEKRQLLLLQALRWRLTKAESIDQRQLALTQYISGDLLNCRSDKMPNSLIDLLKSQNDLRQYMSRLLNAFASLNHGRSYLASNLELVKTMLNVLRNEKEDTYSRKNLVAALQKLSLRQRLQILMINENTIQLLLNLLEDNDRMSDYTLEYAIALLMNLTLKRSGKIKCAEDPERFLNVVSSLIDDNQIQTYVNCSIYNMLSIPAVKEKARAMGLEGIIRNYISDGSPSQVNDQREHIIRKINSDSLEDDNESDDEDEDDEEDAPNMELELDSGEMMIRSPDETFGEQLLITEYSMNNIGNEPRSRSRIESEFLRESHIGRPITPFNLKQSQILQTRQFSFVEQQNENILPPVVQAEKPKPENNSKIKSSVLPSYNSKVRNSMSVNTRNSNGNNRSHSIDKRSTYKPSFSVTSSRNLLDGENKNDNSKKANVLVIESTDINVEDSLISNQNGPVVNQNPQNKLFLPNESVSGFVSKPKIQRTPDQSISAPRHSASVVNASINSTASSFAPKYSISEPRPSSANSNRSKNSSSSSNQNDVSQFNGVNRKK